jgi:hypothetical protein
MGYICFRAKLKTTSVTETKNLSFYCLLMQENDMVFKCLENNNYQNEKCVAYFENYKCCKNFWVCIFVLHVIFLNLWSGVLIKQNNVIACRQEFVPIEDNKVKYPTYLLLRNVRRFGPHMLQAKHLKSLSDSVTFYEKFSRNMQ